MSKKMKKETGEHHQQWQRRHKKSGQQIRRQLCKHSRGVGCEGVDNGPERAEWLGVGAKVANSTIQYLFTPKRVQQTGPTKCALPSSPTSFNFPGIPLGIHTLNGQVHSQ